MKTDQLIDLLSTNLEPVKKGQVKKSLILALIIGGAGAFCVMLSTVGLRPNGTSHLGFLALRLVFTVGLIAAGAALLPQLARPGQSKKRLATLTLFPFLVIAGACIVALGFESPMS